MKVSVLVLPECIAMPCIGIVELLEKTNQLILNTTATEIAQPNRDCHTGFETQLVGVRHKRVQTSMGITITCTRTISDADAADLIIVPALGGDIEAGLAANTTAIDWISEMAHHGTHLASVCTGAFLLAEAGLLDGKAATTHWIEAPRFIQKYPQIHLDPDHFVVDTGQIITSGGATSFLSLTHYIVKKYCSESAATAMSKMFLINRHSDSQNSYATFNSPTQHGDVQIKRAQAYVEQNLSRALSIAELAKRCATSQRSLIRRFKAATGYTPIEYVQQVKIEAAKTHLEKSDSSIEQIAQQVGYLDVPSFRKLFKRVVGLTPSDYRRRQIGGGILVTPAS